jgi:hypothetical protein
MPAVQLQKDNIQDYRLNEKLLPMPISDITPLPVT